MTEAQLRKKVVSIMEGWLGYSEANGKFKKIIDIYNAHKPLAQGYKVKYTDEWCATTVSAAFIQAGLTDIGFTECSCSRMIALYKAKKRWQEKDAYVPKVGDIVMYDWEDSGKGDNTGAPNHVGIVAAINGSRLTIIEGNKGEKVAYRSLDVNGRYIRGYCLPDYASKADKKPEAKPVVKVDAARSHNRAYGDGDGKVYTVTASALNMRTGPGTHKQIIRSIPKGEKVTCFGYYTRIAATVWLLVKDEDGTTGYCSKKYLM